MTRPPSGAAVASLIGVITIILLFYIIFLPPEEREKILSETPPSEDATKAIVEQHTLQSIHLFEAETSIILASINPFNVKKTIFSEEIKNETFLVPDLKNIKSVVLTFQAPTRKGKLEIILNGVQIFKKTVLQETADPIEIPLSSLKEKNNLIFKASGGFFEGKQYTIIDTKILADVIEKERLRSEVSFVVSSEELKLIDKETLSFFARCKQGEVGIITITLNNKKIFSTRPECQKENKIDIAKQELKFGRNNIVFENERGEIKIEQNKIITGLKPQINRQIDRQFEPFERRIRDDFFEDRYRFTTARDFRSFQISRTLFDDIRIGRRDAILIVRFLDSGRNIADVEINDRIIRIDQSSSVFIRDISNFIEEGSNNIRIVRSTSIDDFDVQIR